MARGHTITNADLGSAAARAGELAAEFHSLAETYKKQLGTEDPHVTPMEHARAFAGLARAASDLAYVILVKAANEEDRRSLETEMRARRDAAK